jgi:hypothetical protein
MRRLSRKAATPLKLPYPTEDARVTHFHDRDDRRICIVTVGDHMDAKIAQDPFCVAECLLHEAVHVWQALREEIGEEKPSHEFEAYAIQGISSELMRAYRSTRATKKRRNKA